MPKVSVLMPIYNTKEEYLREAVESILNQTFTDFEFIILNDSPQNKFLDSIIDSYNDKRIIYYKNKQTLGISQSRNKLLDLAQGEYIAIFDHDDISLPARLIKEVEYLDKNSDIGVVSCNVEKFPINYLSNHPYDNEKIKKALVLDNYIQHTAMMVRKSILDKYNIRYKEQFSPAEDYMFVIDLMDYTLFHNLDEILVKYRFGKGTSNLHSKKMNDAAMLCRNIALKRYPYLYCFGTYWVYIFNILPLVKIKKCPDKITYYLFGLIPIIRIAKRIEQQRKM